MTTRREMEKRLTETLLRHGVKLERMLKEIKVIKSETSQILDARKAIKLREEDVHDMFEVHGRYVIIERCLKKMLNIPDDD